MAGVSLRQCQSIVVDNGWVARNFRPVWRDQPMLLAPDVRDWLPADHTVWFVIDAVAVLDTSVFAAQARLGGAGRAPYDPDALLTVMIWAYAGGVSSSRQIERRCREDVSFMVASGLCRPDHATIARFRAVHEQAFEDLFTQVLALCGRAGMGALGHVAIDGTKVAANASMAAMRNEAGLRRAARDLIRKAAAEDAAEDARYGKAGEQQLPEPLRDPEQRRRVVAELLEAADAEPDPKRARSRRHAAVQADRALRLADELTDRRTAAKRRDLQRQITASEGRWRRERAEAQAANDARAANQAAAAAAGRTIPGTRPVPTDQHAKVIRAAARTDTLRQALADLTTNPPPPPPARPGKPHPKRNLTDPDCRIMPTRGGGYLAGYNHQCAVSADYLILAVQVATDTNDKQQLTPMLDKTEQAVQVLRDAKGEPDLAIGTALFDNGYHSQANLTAPGPDRLIAQGTRRQPAGTNPPPTPPPANAPAGDHMAFKLSTPDGKALYRKRAATVEPVNGHQKDRRGLRRFARRGLTAANSEAHLAAAVTNLLRLHTTHGRTALNPA